MVIRAAGESEAIRRKQLTLSSLYIEYLKMEKRNGATPTTVLGGNTSVIVK